MLNLLDANVEFTYYLGQALQHGNTFRPLESLLDFYAYLIIAHGITIPTRIRGEPSITSRRRLRPWSRTPPGNRMAGRYDEHRNVLLAWATSTMP